MDNKLAIIIVNWKQYELTSKCLLSIYKSKFKNQYRLSMILRNLEKMDINKKNIHRDKAYDFISKLR